jgi:hypothetical protein
LYQSKTVGVTKVRHQPRFGTESESAAQIRRLIDSMSRSMQSLDYDIEAEEHRTRCRDCRDPDYSDVARRLTARRDNMAATIAALKKRVADAEAPTYTASLEQKLLLPARG